MSAQPEVFRSGEWWYCLRVDGSVSDPNLTERGIAHAIEAGWLDPDTQPAWEHDLREQAGACPWCNNLLHDRPPARRLSRLAWAD